VPPTWLRLMAKWVGDAETERDFLMERSPVTYADDIVAPLLVIQSHTSPSNRRPLTRPRLDDGARVVGARHDGAR
jgi:hypothetical protein